MKHNYSVAWTDLTREQAQQIDALALAIKQGQPKIDAYIKQQNKPHLVARRWIRRQLIRLLN
jgi:hypothetical protein